MLAARKKGLAGVSDEAVLKDLRRVARKLKVHRLALTEYKWHGGYSWQQVNRRFGSWGKAAARAGLLKSVHSGMDEDELFYNLMAVWAKLGRKPGTEDMRRPVSKYSIRPYLERFGTWRRALAVFFDWLHWGDPPGWPKNGKWISPTLRIGPDEDDLTYEEVIAGKTRRRPVRQARRKPTLRQRFQVMMRDKFRCRLCGRSPATHPGVVLRIDHIVPWSRGGKTIDSNLQTLCEECNQGKSNRRQE